MSDHLYLDLIVRGGFGKWKVVKDEASNRWAMYEYLAARHLASHNGPGNGKGVSEVQEVTSQV